MGPALSLPPLALYIHVPWCVRKCPYCDFNSHEADGVIPEGVYVDALLADLEGELPQVWGRRVVSLFIGGGTPSLFSGEAVERLLSGVRARLPLLPDAEITLEANPGTAEAGRFRDYRQAGVNRLSLGVQSFDDRRLAALGRIHRRGEVFRAVEMARAAGFDNLNLDLMFGLPEQTPREGLADLTEALALAPTHLSWYQLTIEPNTPFHHAPPPLPEDEALWALQEQGVESSAAAGFEQYEVSAYARDGARCRHNLNYWRFGDYLGIGAGAHGKVTLPAEGRVVRRWKARHPRAYLGGERLAGEQVIEVGELPGEFMMNVLRLLDGFDEALFAERTGLPLETVAGPLAEAVSRGLLEREEGRIRPSERGRAFLNDLIALFL
ncbi:radical SAM family heme chaperone HemW [Endothiovibrio diazotrophicus]